MSVSSSYDICSICREDLRVRKDPRMLFCGHIFHPICIDYAFLFQQEKNCPMCREAVHSNGFSGNTQALIKSLTAFEKVKKDCIDYQKIHPEKLSKEEIQYRDAIKVHEKPGVLRIFHFGIENALLRNINELSEQVAIYRRYMWIVRSLACVVIATWPLVAINRFQRE